MTKTKKYVRILKAGEPSYWYINKIGRMFEFEREGDFTYKTREKDGSLAVIRKEDAELIVTEKRPAKVGERILIVNAELGTYNNGQIHKVHKCVSASSDNNEHIVTDAGFVFWTSEYEVIVNNEVKNEEDDEVEIDLDAMGYDELIEHGEAVMRAIRLRSYGEGYKQGKFDADMDATHSPEKEELPYEFSDEDIELAIKEARIYLAQERRDEIVEQAKADIEGLKTDYSYAVLDSNDTDHPHFCFAEFIVDSEKRTIVALLRGNYSCRVYARGIAKAAPEDCFNEHIGKAIALHRALGLEVPEKYLNAPQPTEVRVGDVVLVDSMKNIQELKVVDDGEYIGTGEYKAALTSIAVTKNLIRIIDDSRTEVGE
ncbi:hypothetical protein MOB41_16590 [Bacillus haynesii]|uniref:hypothetical protein n=1 Tax=Bacillus haynesii TaxID=1925021 RepID=UPI002281DAAE|nr:hypothetical protein [Bacillus haynesii]MCY7780018.1 hypothetical protein [Bacillus haynesii]MEC0669701.1 hypothetical protein [Bacillus haynesii]